MDLWRVVHARRPLIRLLTLIGVMGGVVIAACSPSDSALRFPTLPSLDSLFGLNQIDEVVVYAGSFYELYAGDTLRVEANAYYKGQGRGGPALMKAVTFVFSDTTIARAESTTWASVATPTRRARGLKPGLIDITATINGIVGHDSLRVLPAIASFTLPSATIKVGDTASMNLSVLGADGSTLPARFHTLYLDSGSTFVTQLAVGSTRVIGVAPGKAYVHVESQTRRASAVITVVPKGP